MDVNAVTLDPDEAATQLEAYRTIKAPSDEEKAIVAALVAAVASKPLVNLADAVRGGGCFEDGAPRLAVSVPMYAWCYVSRSHQSGMLRYRPTDRTRPERDNFWVGGFEPMDWDALHAANLIDSGWSRGRRTQVPIVPPQHRVRGWKTRCVVLWEVEEWATVSIPQPPGDPMLLRHLVGDLYSVEATWDLTPLEQLVLGSRI